MGAKQQLRSQIEGAMTKLFGFDASSGERQIDFNVMMFESQGGFAVDFVDVDDGAGFESIRGQVAVKSAISLALRFLGCCSTSRALCSKKSPERI